MDNSHARVLQSLTLGDVQWDRLFEDLEGQLASEWEAERAALDAESERLRIAKLDLRARMRGLVHRGAAVTVELSDGERRTVTVETMGADWIGARPSDSPALLLIRLPALISVEMDHGMLLESLEDQSGPTLRERMTFGFVLRDLARRRIPVRIAQVGGGVLHGTIDRAGADHLDLAIHDPGEPRRADAVRAFRVIPFDGVIWASAGVTNL